MTATVSSAADENRPVSLDEFTIAIAALGPFEPEPHIAVAVSGGRDSIALALLADRWARSYGGRITALTVDHRLRADSARDAQQVKHWMRARDIAHRTLSWRHGGLTTGVQARARAERYRLLCAYCRGHGILHLLLGHQSDDQAETVLMRRARKSGPDGLAAMASTTGRHGVRLLRPLLQMPRRRLTATLNDWGQPWLDDPSNANLAFERARLRRAGGAGGSDQSRNALLCEASDMANRRSALDRDAAVLAATAVKLFPSGYALLRAAPFAAASPLLQRRLLTRLTMCIGGGVYPARSDRRDRLLQAMREGSLAGGRTLAGCRVSPYGEGYLISREFAALPARTAVDRNRMLNWDRFAIRVSAGVAPDTAVGALGQIGSRQLRQAGVKMADIAIPSLVRTTLPALWQGDDLLAAPHIDGVAGRLSATAPAILAEFRPPQPLAPIEFTVA